MTFEGNANERQSGPPVRRPCTLHQGRVVEEGIAQVVDARAQAENGPATERLLTPPDRSPPGERGDAVDG